MAVLVPTLIYPPGNVPSKTHPILDFSRNKAWSGTEKIATWSTSPSEYIGDFKPGANNIFYATRLHDGTRGGGRYYSAYRYEKKGNELHITVRELKLTPDLTLNDIAKESYWESPLLWNRREYKRTIPKGVYWSTSWSPRLLGVRAHHGLKVFTDYSMDQLARKDFGAFVGGEDFGQFADNPNLPKNKKSKSSILMTTQREP